ncbi:MAG TPA: hypothetical protein VMW74_09920 [Nitrosopumilaceae archaeon]|nr:hypothetical protein [Nitrosopumilaceae archaeon]
MPKKLKTGLFTYDEREKLRSTDTQYQLSRQKENELFKSNGKFDQRLEGIIDDIKLLLQKPNILKTAFKKHNKRYHKFYDLVDLIRIFDDFDSYGDRNSINPETKNIHNYYFNRVPIFTIQKQTNGKFQLVEIVYSPNEGRKIKTGISKPIFFYNAMKKNTHLSEKQWNYLEKWFQFQNKNKVFMPYVIPLKENKQYTWKQIEKKISEWSLIHLGEFRS